jgi:NTE family protein
MNEAVGPQDRLGALGRRLPRYRVSSWLSSRAQLGLLDRVAILSTVSGGSVIGASFHAHLGDFSSFETKIRELLAQGLVVHNQTSALGNA